MLKLLFYNAFLILFFILYSIRKLIYIMFYFQDNSWLCILQKYHLLNEDNTLDMERYHAHLDKWIELNPAFYTVIHEARSKCKYRFNMYFPLKAEEYFTFQTCIRTYVNIVRTNHFSLLLKTI